MSDFMIEHEAECPRCHRPIRFTLPRDYVFDFDMGVISDDDGGVFVCETCGQYVVIDYVFEFPQFYAHKVSEEFVNGVDE